MFINEVLIYISIHYLQTIIRVSKMFKVLLTSLLVSWMKRTLNQVTGTFSEMTDG